MKKIANSVYHVLIRFRSSDSILATITCQAFTCNLIETNPNFVWVIELL